MRWKEALTCCSEPVAVGELATSSNDMKKFGMKGKGVKVMHYVRDFLW
jgi:predicted ribosome-associated RNA-binding protein Tma20